LRQQGQGQRREEAATSEPIGPLPWPARAGAVALLAVLLVTVAVASHATLEATGSPSKAVSPTSLPAAAVGIPAILAIASGLAFFATVLRPARRRRRDPEQPDWVYEPPPTSRSEKALLLLALLLFAGALAGAAWLFTPRGGSSQPGPPATAGRSVPATAPPSAPTSPAHPRQASRPWQAAGVAAAAAGVGLLAVWAVRRRRDQATDIRPDSGLLVDVLDTSLEDLRVVSDPRQAILAAYAGMERALSPRGVGRQRHETALEYLDRLLGRLELEPAPLQRLTALFQLAKFSNHQVTEAMRDDALAALGTISTALRSTS
jgi:uncharacterized protein DUF4129